ETALGKARQIVEQNYRQVPNLSRRKHLLCAIWRVVECLSAAWVQHARTEQLRKSKRFRALLRYRKTGLLIAVVLAQRGKDRIGDYWRIDAPKVEGKRTAIVAFPNEENTTIQSLRLFRQLGFPRFVIRNGRDDEWLSSGRLLTEVKQFVEVLEQVRAKTGL